MLLLAATAAGAAMLLPSSLPFELYAPRATNVVVAPVAAAAGRWEAQWLRKDPRRPGYWSGNVSGMQPGDGYVFRVDGADRVDPSCVDIAQNSTHSVVPRPYTWRNPRRVVSSQARAVIYEMQVGSFTPEGTFSSAMAKLPYLAALGITLVELMPVMHYCGPADSWGCVSCSWSCVPNAPRPRCGRGLP
jgi:maltooligosyltrehalose trehalohydrolase